MVKVSNPQQLTHTLILVEYPPCITTLGRRVFEWGLHISFALYFIPEKKVFLVFV